MKSWQRLGMVVAVAWVFAMGGANAQFGGGPQLTVEVAPPAEPVRPGESAQIEIAVTIPDKWHVNANKPRDEYLIPTEITLESQPGFTVTNATYPEPSEFRFADSDDVLLVYGGRFVVGLTVAVAPDAAPGDYPLQGSLQYQACNDAQCWAPTSLEVTVPLTVAASSPRSVEATEPEPVPEPAAAPPEPATMDDEPPASTEAPHVGPAELALQRNAQDLLSRFTVVAQAGGYMKPPAFLAFLDAAEQDRDYEGQGALSGKGIWFVIGAALIGGLLLNLTPCVLPIIPVTLAIIGAGTRSGSRARGVALGATYGMGIAAAYGVLGVVAVLGLGSFGALNATPWFNLGIAVVFALLGLSLFDVFLIDFSRFQAKVGLKQQQGNVLFAFLMGCINALLAGACVAPLVIAVILYSQDLYAKGMVVALALPFLLGVGMALPWPLVGGGISVLPKPGKWMVHLKHAFGLAILLMAAYYAYLGITLYRDRYLVDPNAVAASAESLDEEGWYASLAEGLVASEAEGKPVLIDFWASWCKNCLVMNKTTFVDPAVRERLQAFVPIKYQAEIPDQSPAKDVLSRFDRYVGLPHYAVLKPNGDGAGE